MPDSFMVTNRIFENGIWGKNRGKKMQYYYNARNGGDYLKPDWWKKCQPGEFAAALTDIALEFPKIGEEKTRIKSTFRCSSTGTITDGKIP
jgi:hypothetical protein